MRRPLLGIFLVWILGELVASWLGIALVPATSLDMAMVDRESAMVTIQGSVCRFRRTTKGFSYELAECQVVQSGDVYTTHHLLVFTDDIQKLRIGNRVEVAGELSCFDQATNPGQFDMDAYYRAQGIDYSVWEQEVQVLESSCLFVLQRIWEFREALRENLLVIAPEDESGIFLSLFLGDRSGMNAEIKSLYQNGGISHILAISGLHISLFGMALYHILRRVGCSSWMNPLISGSLMGAYVWMTGASASAIRAFLMFLVYILANALGRSYDQLSALSLAGLLLLAEHPLLLWQSGFQLSFLAMVGVSIVWPLLQRWFASEERKKTMDLSAVGFTLSIQLVTLPVLAASFFMIPTYGVFLNLIVLPLTGFLLGGTAISAAAMELLQYLGFYALKVRTGEILILGARGVLVWYEMICRFTEALPGAAIVTGKPSTLQILVYYLIVSGILLILYRDCLRNEKERHLQRIQKVSGRMAVPTGSGKQKRRIPNDIFSRISAAAGVGILLILILCTRSNCDLKITMLDVGQGDCICIQVPGGRSCLIDGGSTSEKNVGTYRILPFLKSQGIHHLSTIFISHGDEDHINGLLEVLADRVICVDSICLSEASLQDEELTAIRELAEARKVPIRVLRQGDRWEWEGVDFTCLYPSNGAIQRWEMDKNDSSLVLKLEYGAFSGIFTGDLAEEGERELLQGEEISEVTLLKVGHHGSRYSSCDEFLRELQPALSVISCGAGNRYGHPHEETLERLQAVGTVIRNTAKTGAVCMEIAEESGEIHWYQTFR